MRNIFAVYVREIKSYFSSQIFYIIAAVFLLTIGNVFKNSFFRFASQSMSQQRYYFTTGDTSINYLNVNSVALSTFQYTQFILLLIVPILTMRLFSEEKKNGTIELLMTSPITTTQILLGKYFSCFSIYSLLVLLTSLFTVILTVQSQGQLDILPVLSTFLGTFLLGLAIIPIGIFASSLTENQIVAAMITLSISLGFWLILYSAQVFEYPFNRIIEFISLSGHLITFGIGYVGVQHIVYYFSMATFWLFLSWISIESARWRQ